MPKHAPTPAQPELPMDHAPALERQMREVFDQRWRRWHLVKDFDRAMQDPITRRLLELTVQHMPALPAPKKCRR